MKPKMSYKLSKTEFWLLTLLGVVVVIALSVTYLIAPAWDTLTASAGQLIQAELKLTALKKDYGNLEQYKAQLTKQNTDLDSLHEQMPAYYSQEKTVAALDDAASKSGLQLISLAFTGVKTDPKASFITQLQHQKTDAAAPAPAAASANGAQQTLHVSDMVRYERMKVGFAGTYGQLYQFLDNVAAQPRKLFARELVVTRAKGGMITGSVTLLVMSGAAAEGDPYPGYTFDAAQSAGKQDPFMAFPGYIEDESAGTAGQTAAVNPNFYIIINTYDDNSAKVLMGKYELAASELRVNANKTAAASITFSENNGLVAFTYTLEGQTYNGTLQTANSTDPIVISVLSRARKDAKDNTGVSLSVTNNTARQVSVDLRNDDLSRPRFALGATTGAVKIG